MRVLILALILAGCTRTETRTVRPPKEVVCPAGSHLTAGNICQLDSLPDTLATP